MPRLCAVLSVPVLLVGLSQAAPIPPDASPAPALFFPTRLGDRMVHSVGGHDYTTVVSEVEEAGAGRRVTVRYELPDARTAHQTTVEVSPKGILELSSSGRQLPDPVWELKLSPQADATWGGKWPLFRGPGDCAFAQQEYTATGWETIEVPAGKFRTIRVERDSRLDGVSRPSTHWYAAGLGCVKWRADTSESVLTSFTPGKE